MPRGIPNKPAPLPQVPQEEAMRPIEPTLDAELEALIEPEPEELIPVTLEWSDGTATRRSQVVMMPRNANGRFVFTQNYDTSIIVEWVSGQ